MIISGSLRICRTNLKNDQAPFYNDKILKISLLTYIDGNKRKAKRGGMRTTGSNKSIAYA